MLRTQLVRRVRRSLGLGIAVFCVVVVAHAQATVASDDAPAGRLNFDAANLPAANLEVDLSQEMFKDLFNIGDAAIAGIAETVLNSTEGGPEAHKHIQLAAEQIEAARQIVQLLGNVVHEVRIRAYESLPEDAGDAQDLFKPFDEQLRSAKWETLVRVRSDDQIGRVSVLRRDGAVQGIFVVATDGDGVAIVNLVCDISPDNVKKLAAAATKIGLKANFQPTIQLNLSQLPGAIQSAQEVPLQKETHLTSPVSPTPPARSASPVKK